MPGACADELSSSAQSAAPLQRYQAHLGRVDIRTVAGRIGHPGGGVTTLRVYSAWRSEADQRAASSLAGRMPARPGPAVDRIERAKTDP